MVLVAILPVLVALVVAVACITTVAATVVAVLVALLIVGRPLFAAYLGAVPLLAVRTIAVVLFVVAFLTRGTVFLVGRRRLIYGFVGLRRGRLACFLFYIL